MSKPDTRSKENKSYDRNVISALESALKLAKSGRFYALALFVADERGLSVVVPGHQDPKIDAHIMKTSDELRAAMTGALMGRVLTSSELGKMMEAEGSGVDWVSDAFLNPTTDSTH